MKPKRQPVLVMITRVWDRDGSRNMMLLDTAVANLQRWYPGVSNLAEQLRDGKRLRTPRAEFRVLSAEETK